MRHPAFRTRIALFWLVLLACFCLSCGKSEPQTVPQNTVPKGAASPDEVRWVYGPKGVRLNVKAAADLNMEDGQAHTVLICLYQLSKPDGFHKLAASPEGMAVLLQCGAFDDSVTDFKQEIISPGMVAGFLYDRAEETKHTALAAGFAGLEPRRCVKTWPIPVEKKSGGMFDDDEYFAGGIDMAVMLGAQGIQDIGR